MAAKVKCKAANTANIVRISKNATVREVLSLKGPNTHLVDEDDHCYTCSQKEMMDSLLSPVDHIFRQWHDAHRTGVQHVDNVGRGGLVWCANCGPWWDDDYAASPEELLNSPYSEYIAAVFVTEKPTPIVTCCPMCTG